MYSDILIAGVNGNLKAGYNVCCCFEVDQFLLQVCYFDGQWCLLVIKATKCKLWRSSAPLPLSLPSPCLASLLPAHYLHPQCVHCLSKCRNLKLASLLGSHSDVFQRPEALAQEEYLDQKHVHVLIDSPEPPPPTKASPDWLEGQNSLINFGGEYLCYCSATKLQQWVSPKFTGIIRNQYHYPQDIKLTQTDWLWSMNESGLQVHRYRRRHRQVCKSVWDESTLYGTTSDEHLHFHIVLSLVNSKYCWGANVLIMVRSAEQKLGMAWF